MCQCTATDLSAATNLSRSTFLDPLAEYLRKFGREEAERFPYANPFKSLVVSSYSNIALSYAGNPQLTTSAGLVPTVEPGRLRREDEIQRGRQAVFSGYSDLKMLIFVTLPALCVLSTLSVLACLYARNGSISFRNVLSYLKPSQHLQHVDSLTYLYMTISRRPVLCMLFVIGISLVLLNVFWKGVYDSYGGCVDPLVRTTIAHVRVDYLYQGFWVVLNCAAVTIVDVVVHLHGQQRHRQALRVHDCLCKVFKPRCEKASLEYHAVKTWHSKIRSSRIPIFLRTFSFCLLHLPLVIIASAPACGYVFSQK